MLRIAFYLLSFFMAWPIGAVFIPGQSLYPTDQMPYIEGNLLVKISDNAPEDALELSASMVGAQAFESYTIVPGLWLYKYDTSLDIADVLAEFHRNPYVVYAEPDYVYNIAAQNDPRFPEQWDMENTGQTGGVIDADVNALSMWAIESGDPKVVIAVIDTGVDYTHQDLVDNLWRNTLEIPGDNIDNDGNGYIDDVYGINAILNNGNPMDDNSHGTHVSGTIGALGNNNLGVVGMAQDVQIVACKFLNASGSGGITAAIRCMQYLADLKSRANSPVNIIASNNSWGGGGASQAMLDAIKTHQRLGILFVAASGNSAANTDNTIFYPAGYDVSNVISVAATDNSDRLATFSNYGRRTVHVAAPGVRILSTVPNQGYAAYSGTSMASPHVAGLVAIIASYYPTMDIKGIKNLIMASGTSTLGAKDTISGRRIRGADVNGTGALTCNNQQVNSRIQPIASSASIKIGDKLFLSALKINCDKSAGGTITLYSDANQSIILKDDGLGADQLASDGVYSLLWTAQFPGTYQLNYGGGDIVTITVTGSVVKKYNSYNNVGYQYETITGTALNAGDDTIHTVSLPFPIYFNGDANGFSTIYISSNGTVDFANATNPGYGNKALPTNIKPSLIACYWDDLVPTGLGSDVYYATTGTSPNRKFVVEWRNMKHFSSSGTGTFQVVFGENSPDIRFNYLDTLFGNTTIDAGLSATVGVQSDAAIASQYSYNTANIPSLSSVLFRFE